METQTLHCKAGTGKLVHVAISSDAVNPFSGRSYTEYKALCGRREGRNAQHRGYILTSIPVNCPNCLTAQRTK